MYAALGTVAIVGLISMIVTRIAAGAFVATGLPYETARFQARSAFTGVGFTTDESSLIVRHPQRRKIAFRLMILGNLGTATVLASLVVGLVAPGPLGANIRFLVVIGGLLVLFLALRLSPIDRAFTLVGLRTGRRWAGADLVGEPVEIAEVDRERVVSEVTIAPDAEGPDGGRLDLPTGTVLVLGVKAQDGSYRDVWAPNGATTYSPGETVLLYGDRRVLDRLAPAREPATPER
jgi:hypothetical protein